jgi:hypothetical protein
MSIKSFFSNTCETKELHTDPDLRTNYYRNNFTQVLDALKQIAEQENLEIRDVNKTHREIYMLGSGFDVIVTISEITPIEIGIDFKVNWFSGFGFHRPRKKVLEFYAKLKNLLRFKGISLHP